MVFPAIHLRRPYVRARVTWYPVVTLCPIPHVPAIHLARQSALYGPLGHIRSRDGIDLCPSSAANPSRHHSRTHRLARCFAGRPPEGHLTDTDLPHTAVRARLVPNPSRSCNSSDTAIAILGASRPYRLARCFAGRSPNDIELPHKALRARLVPGPTLSCNSSDIAIAILRVSRAYPLARWHRFVSIERRDPLQTALQGISARAMFCRKATGRSPN